MIFQLCFFVRSECRGWAERLQAGSEEEAVRCAASRLAEATYVDLWRGDEWVCRWEKAAQRPIEGHQPQRMQPQPLLGPGAKATGFLEAIAGVGPWPAHGAGNKPCYDLTAAEFM
jgi:hypothetical protein